MTIQRKTFANNSRYCLLSSILICGLPCGSVRAETIQLGNHNLCVSIDSASACITGLDNKLTGEKTGVNSLEFRIVTHQGEISSDRMKVTGLRRVSNRVDFELSGEGCSATLVYALGDAWVEKWMTLKPAKTITIHRVTMGSRTFSPAFENIHGHTEGTIYNVPVNWFLRAKKGGWYTGVEFPFTEASEADGPFALAFGGWEYHNYLKQPGHVNYQIPGNRPLCPHLADMNYEVKTGSEFVSEKEFLGVYRNVGSSCKREINGMPRVLTTNPENLDWGEVWAMQHFMRNVLPEIPSSYDGYMLYLNAYWAGCPNGAMQPEDVLVYKKAIDNCKAIGARMFCCAGFWMGMDRFFRKNTAFIRSVGVDGDLKLSRPAQEVYDYFKAQNMWMLACSEGSSYYREDQPKWKAVSPGGRASGSLCWANKDAADWFFRLHSNTFSRYSSLRYWCWDGGWLPGVPEGVPGLNFECRSEDHGHAPGNVAYASYKNVMSIFQRLREHNPTVELGVAWAVECGGPWALKDLSVRENFYECAGPDDLRFQMWCANNSRFAPPEKNMTLVYFNYVTPTNLPQDIKSTWERYYTEVPRDYKYGFLSALSGGTSMGWMAQWPKFANDRAKQEYLSFMNKWTRWASDNMSILKVKRDIFGTPLRPNGIDGSVHVVGDHGFVFIFNPTAQRHIGSIPFDSNILLTRRETYEARDVFPADGQSLGAYAYGKSLLVDMPPASCRVVEIRPDIGEAVPAPTPSGADVQEAFAR